MPGRSDPTIAGTTLKWTRIYVTGGRSRKVLHSELQLNNGVYRLKNVKGKYVVSFRASSEEATGPGFTDLGEYDYRSDGERRVLTHARIVT